MIRLGVFGSPVTQSLSPEIHRHFAAQFELAIDYDAIDSPPGQFRELLEGFIETGGSGCNVTVPLKTLAYELASETCHRTRLAGAANTLLIRSAKDIEAHNTDGPGLLRDLQHNESIKLTGMRICLLGAGGAAAGVLASLLEAGPSALIIANRTVDKADTLARRHVGLGAVSTVVLDEIDQAGPFDLVINATAMGHASQAPGLRPALMSAGGVCYDMNYSQAARPLRELCGSGSIRYQDGLGMLVEQAALSFEIWTGKLPETQALLSRLRIAH